MPADFLANATLTLTRLQNQLAALVLILGIAGCCYGVFKLAEFAISLGGYGWGYWRKPMPLNDPRRAELNGVVHHVPHRNGFAKTREYVVNGQDVRR